MMLFSRTARRAPTVLIASSWALLAACMEVADDRGGDGGPEGCEMCHPRGGLSAAHAAHIDGVGDYQKSYACAECHPAREEWFVDGHMDAVVDVAFPDDGLARARGGDPVWDGVSICAGVYCHGATLGGGTYTEPGWYDEPVVEGLSLVHCGSCHSLPPPDPHPNEGDCARCHEAAYNGDDLDPAIHIDGQVNREGDDDDEGEDDGLAGAP
jgi:predicted CxxxxCH...CXXCH cytochrome family protein